ncbi:MAG: phospholipase A [Gammaproteobacteria bacterium]|nr:phospholipase A [Gammaproteobacteria bacterium]MDH5802167.1 phospholipase A [Gammaproteobacteria bacterium]
MIRTILILILLFGSTVAASGNHYSESTDSATSLEHIRNVCGVELSRCELSVYRGDELETRLNSEKQTVVLLPGSKVDYFVPYKQNYIALGARNDNSTIDRDGKIQVSMKHTLYDDGQAKKLFKEKFYMGYSFKTVWRVWEPSSPFEDHNFDLELFYCSDDANCDSLNQQLAGFQHRYYVGLEHESNGRDGTDSRSWNRGYFRWLTWQGRHAYSAKLWYVGQHGKNNEDIEDYLGYSQLQYDYRGDHIISAMANVGPRGNVLLDWAKKSGKTATLHYYAQLFGGYGESLLYYNEKRYAFRIGIRLYQ